MFQKSNRLTGKFLMCLMQSCRVETISSFRGEDRKATASWRRFRAARSCRGRRNHSLHVCVCVCVCVCACACMCVCVCVCERERESLAIKGQLCTKETYFNSLLPSIDLVLFTMPVCRSHALIIAQATLMCTTINRGYGSERLPHTK